MFSELPYEMYMGVQGPYIKLIMFERSWFLIRQHGMYRSADVCAAASNILYRYPWLCRIYSIGRWFSCCSQAVWPCASGVLWRADILVVCCLPCGWHRWSLAIYPIRKNKGKEACNTTLGWSLNNGHLEAMTLKLKL